MHDVGRWGAIRLRGPEKEIRDLITTAAGAVVFDHSETRDEEVAASTEEGGTSAC